MDNRFIGIMDSGVGGLTVAKYIKENYPLEGIIFIGDTLHNPYGSLSSENIALYAERLKQFLLQQNIKMLIIGCNTISFNTPSSFYEEDIPVIPMSLKIPCLEEMEEVTVLATPATINTHKHKYIIEKQYPNIIIHEIGLPTLAHAIEMGASEREVDAIIKKEVSKHQAQNTEMAFLACTHYPLVLSSLKKYLPKAKFWDPAQATVEYGMQALLKKEAHASSTGQKKFYFTSDVSIAEPLVKNLFGTDANIEEINL